MLFSTELGKATRAANASAAARPSTHLPLAETPAPVRQDPQIQASAQPAQPAATPEPPAAMLALAAPLQLPLPPSSDDLPALELPTPPVPPSPPSPGSQAPRPPQPSQPWTLGSAASVDDPPHTVHAVVERLAEEYRLADEEHKDASAKLGLAVNNHNRLEKTRVQAEERFKTLHRKLEAAGRHLVESTQHALRAKHVKDLALVDHNTKHGVKGKIGWQLIEANLNAGCVGPQDQSHAAPIGQSGAGNQAARSNSKAAAKRKPRAADSRTAAPPASAGVANKAGACKAAEAASTATSTEAAMSAAEHRGQDTCAQLGRARARSGTTAGRAANVDVIVVDDGDDDGGNDGGSAAGAAAPRPAARRTTSTLAREIVRSDGTAAKSTGNSAAPVRQPRDGAPAAAASTATAATADAVLQLHRTAQPSNLKRASRDDETQCGDAAGSRDENADTNIDDPARAIKRARTAQPLADPRTSHRPAAAANERGRE
ncbi:hypothetical protein HK105_207559 [Polyrhizophydium stewartii]|uniref:Uncharacterized protein n=1 Tax=Polyrhizophydium stewartii TaxID=2732419 RepID=A0ABR4N0L9_9FUNG